jgi:hypothetical protein
MLFCIALLLRRDGETVVPDFMAGPIATTR